MVVTLWTNEKGGGMDGSIPPALEADNVYVLKKKKARRSAWVKRERWEGLPYADGTTAQTRANEATKVGVRSIEAYSTLGLLLLLLLFARVWCHRRGLVKHSGD